MKGKHYINWSRECDVKEVISPGDMNDLVWHLAEEEAKGYMRVKNSWNPDGNKFKTKMADWDTRINKTLWTIDKAIDGFVVYIMKETEDTIEYHSYYTSEAMMKKGESGSQHAFAKLDAKVKELHNGTITSIIGGINGKEKISYKDTKELLDYVPNSKEQEEVIDYKLICPPRLQWYNKALAGKKVCHYNKIDITNAYPSVAGLLPDYHTKLEVKGRASLEDYPDYDFAFYRKSHEVIERNVFDSNDIRKRLSKYNLKFNHCNVKDEDEITVFMKYAKEDLSDVWQYFFEKRKTDNGAKIIMNATIGCFESLRTAYVKSFKAFAAAVIYYRHLTKMANTIEELERRDNEVIHLAIDSIGWLGKEEADLSVKDKQLGLFHSEYVDAEICIKANGVYCIHDKEGFHIKSQGTPIEQKRVESSFADVTDIMSLKTERVQYEEYEINGIKCFMIFFEERSPLEEMIHEYKA